MKRLLFALLFLAAFGPVFAANVYICNTASGTGTGADFTNAKTTLDSVTWTRGNTYIIAGTASTYTLSSFIGTAEAGTTRITIRKANAAQDSGVAGWTSSFGTTKARIVATSTTWGGMYLDTGYFTVDGITGSGTSGYGIEINYPFTTAGAPSLTLGNANGYIITHLEITGPGSAASAFAVDGLKWSASGKKGSSFTNLYIHDCTTNGITVVGGTGTSYSDYAVLIDGVYITENGLCTDAGNHGQALGFGLGSSAYFIIRNSVFRNDAGTAALSFRGTGTMDHIQFYNNVVYFTDLSVYGTLYPGVIWSEASNTNTNWFLANNSFYGLGDGSHTGVTGSLTISGTNTSIVSENNVWENCRMIGNSGTTIESNNGYFGNTGPGIPSGTTNQVNGASTTFTAAGSGNFTIKSGGYALAAGLNLTSTFTTYADGTSRANSAFDLGPLPAASPAPILSSATINAAGTTLTTVFTASVSTGANGSGGMKITTNGTDYTASSPSGSGSVTYAWTVQKQYQNAVATVTYTQPTNGLEATSDGTDVASFSAQAVTNSSTQVIPPPTSPSATKTGQSTIDVGWTDGSSGVTSFIIYRSLTNGSFVQVGTASVGAVVYHDSGLSANTQYFYVVASTAQGLTSTQTSSVNATTDPAVSPNFPVPQPVVKLGVGSAL